MVLADFVVFDNREFEGLDGLLVPALATEHSTVGGLDVAQHNVVVRTGEGASGSIQQFPTFPSTPALKKQPALEHLDDGHET